MSEFSDILKDRMISFSNILQNTSRIGKKISGYYIQKGVRKKFNKSEIDQMCVQTSMYTYVELLQALLVVCNEVEEMQDENKFEIMKADIEALLISVFKDFQRLNDERSPYMPKMDVQELRELAKTWNVTVEDIKN